MSLHQTIRTSDQTRRPLFAITLIDRRTGRPHRVSNAPLMAFSRDPASAAADLLPGRDAAIWDTRIQPLPGSTLN